MKKPFVFNKRFKGYAEGTEPFPAEKTKNEGSGCVLLFMVPFVLAGIFMAVMCVRSIYHFALFKTEGEVTQGVVVDKNTYTDSSGDTTYHVSYNFEAGGQNYSGKAQVNWDLYNAVQKGGEFGVRYAGNHPDINDADENSVWFEPIFFTIFCLFWNGFVGIFIYAMVAGGNKDRADQPGTVVAGTLDGCRVYSQNNDTRVEITYNFLSPRSGRTIRTRWDGPCPDMVGRKKPEAGEAIAVNFIDEKRFRPL